MKVECLNSSSVKRRQVIVPLDIKVIWHCSCNNFYYVMYYSNLELIPFLRPRWNGAAGKSQRGQQIKLHQTAQYHLMHFWC